MKRWFRFLSVLTFLLSVFTNGSAQVPVMSSGPMSVQKSAKTATNQRILSGIDFDEDYGYTVSQAGDVNGDGYDDYMVGAPYSTEANYSAGKIYMYYGAKSADYVPDLYFYGQTSNEHFGIALSSAGDVNGDGYDDIIVGADENSVGSGKAYIFFGGSSMNNAPDLVLDGESPGDYFGTAVASAGDVNGDGFSDVIVGAYSNTGAFGNGGGKAYLYYGGKAMDSIPDVILNAQSTGEYFGISVSSAGDVNRDGLSDIIIGASANLANGVNAGAAYLFLGNTQMDSIPDMAIWGQSTGNKFGQAVASAGDINGDGYDDVIIGSPGSGQAYLLYGGTTLDNTPDLVIGGQQSGDQFGKSVAGIGDLNNDGYMDIAIGAFSDDQSGPDAGACYVYFGAPVPDTGVDYFLRGEYENSYLGISVSGAGDTNGDGYDDFIAGADGNGPSYEAPGRAYLVFHTVKNSNSSADVIFFGKKDDALGISVANAGDVNGDGFDDLIIGASKSMTGIGPGKARLYFGGAAPDTNVDVTFNGQTNSDFFGFAVAGAGDVNGDGYDDILIGAYGNGGYPPGGGDPGRAYLYYGGKTVDNTPDVTFTANVAGDWFGATLDGAGDVNGDGFADIVIGAEFNNQAGFNTGKVYIYYGGYNMNNAVDLTFTGENPEDRFGSSVSFAGDVNNDGYDDLLISAFENDEGGSNAGKVYLYYGAPNMNNTEDFTFIGEADSAYLGIVSNAGDVNGDGFDDLLMGTPANSENGMNAGKAYLHFGGAMLDHQPDLTFLGENTEDQFGGSLAGAGDVNRDGYDDIVIGALFNDGQANDGGKAYLYFGSANMDNRADRTMAGKADMEGFARAVSFAGDVNNDGFDDVIFGSWQFENGGYNGGKAYLYLSSPLSVQPNLFYAKDVAHDQGGRINLRWSRSAYDDPLQAAITEYVIQRSDNPANDYAWENLIEIPAATQRYYAAMAPTPIDSTSQDGATFFYRVLARTSEPHEIWYSNIVSAYSVDNLAPATVQNLVARLENGPQVKLNWDINPTDPDIRYYRIYRSDQSDFTPSEQTLIAVISDTSYLDVAPVDQQINYYRIIVEDIHENRSDPSVQASVNLTGIAEAGENALPNCYHLWQNYPNPFNPQTTIRFDLPFASRVTLEIYSIDGRLVERLADQPMMAGHRKVAFLADGFASGIYIYRLRAVALSEYAPAFVSVKKMMLLK